MKEYKMYVKDPETSELVQKHAFSLGYAWICNSARQERSIRKIVEPGSPLLYFCSDGDMSYVDNDCFEYFREKNCTELTPEEFLELIPEDIKEDGEKTKLWLYAVKLEGGPWHTDMNFYKDDYHFRSKSGNLVFKKTNTFIEV